ncbi:MAG: PHP domain-containing protein [Dehalococcoidales bacterium]|nr:PHP domain-containing protein [Dehalococcoidales bacterium]
MPQVDLHIHSNYSDGKFSPKELVEKAVNIGLKVMAISDHDSVDGIPSAVDAAKAYPQLTFIPGVEISTDVPNGEIHVLGYFIDYNNPELLSTLLRMRESRVERARKMVNKLASLGIKVEWERVLQIAQGSSVGRPHIAQAMQEKGYISSFKEAFNKYIGRNGPAYVERGKMTPAEAVKLIIKSGGLAVFAHPITYKDYETAIIDMVTAGLVGVEAYYNNSTVEDIRKILSLADKYNLVPTGGSDYHGIEATEVQMGGVEVPLSSAERLIALVKETK